MQHKNRDNKLTPIIQDARLPDEIRPVQQATLPQQSINNAFITGATGFLGRYVIKSLLQHTELQLTCLIRADNVAQARQRLSNALKQVGFDDITASKIHARINVICGDLAQPQLGLSPEAYTQLAQSIDTIYHCAALVNWARSYRKLRHINVLGTLAIIRFACQSRPKPLLFASSMAVCYATNQEGLVDEQTNMLPHITHMPLGYAQSKCVAENLLQQVAERGLPVTILRPALISGDTESGMSNTEDFIAALLEGCVRTGMAMDEDWLLDFVPVDFVADVIASQPLVHSIPANQATILHVVADRPRHWRELILWLNLYGYPIELMPPSEWLNQVFKDRKHCGNRLYNYRRFFQGLPGQTPQQAKPYECYLQMGQQRITSNASLDRLKSVRLDIPNLDAVLLERYLSYFQRTGLLPKLPPLLSAHRNKVANQQTLENILQQPAIKLQSLPLNTDNGILNQIAAAYGGAAIGLRAYHITDTAIDIVVKTKCADTLVENSTVKMVALCSPELGQLFRRFSGQLGLSGAQKREAALYTLPDPVFRQYTPQCFGTHNDDENGLTTIVLEKLPETARTGEWGIQQIQAVINGLAHIQSVDRITLKPLIESGLLAKGHSTEAMLAMRPLWSELVRFAARQNEEATQLLPLQERYIDELDDWWPQLLESPQSLMHGDFSPRNLILRPCNSQSGPVGRLCAFDWELAALGAPQRDLAEFLCFTLSAHTRESTIVDGLIEQHRQRYTALSRTSISAKTWQQGCVLSLQQFVICRLPLYAVMHRFRPQAFLPVLYENALWLSRHFTSPPQSPTD